MVMMLRLQNERMNGALLLSPQEFFKVWGLTAEKLAEARADAIVMHPAPMRTVASRSIRRLPMAARPSSCLRSPLVSRSAWP